ncbi:MAG: serine/threonine protein kinase [Planctomycetes bacterium]|nr:serine/threonine protein kinase [Planctomycetota bacterium]
MAEANGNQGSPQNGQAADGKQGAQIPGYQVLSKIGAGAQATVYKAKQLSLNRIVAVKVLSKRLSSDGEFVARFFREAQAVAKLNHPNIIQAIDYGEIGGRHYFVTEFVDGYTVQDEITKGKVYSEVDAMSIILQIAKALDHAHGIGLIHRDVKPSNIMVTQDGKAKLADMGLAVATVDLKNAIETSKMYGTPYYISPEQILGKADIDFRADIYSLGATLFHMVTGRRPFTGKNVIEVLEKHLKAPLESPDMVNLDLLPPICRVIEKMMQKEPAKRQANTAQLVHDLESVDFLLEQAADDKKDGMPLGHLSIGQDEGESPAQTGKSAAKAAGKKPSSVVQQPLTAPPGHEVEDIHGPWRPSVLEILLAALLLISIVGNVLQWMKIL